MNLLKTSFFTSISTAIRIIAGFIINKVIAIYIGPAGLALIGQFMNFVSIVLSFSNGGINSGIVKYVAEYKDDNDKRSMILSSSVLISLFCSIILSITIIIFSKPMAEYLLRSNDYRNIFTVFGATLVTFSLNSSLLSVLNGYKEIKKFVTLNILTSLIGLLITSILVVLYRLYGSLLAIVISQTLMFFVTLIFVVKSDWFYLHNFVRGIDYDSIGKLSKFSIMAIATAVTYPVSQIIVRNYIADHVSLDAAGYWQGVWKISEVYLLVITTSLSVYYLPRLSEITDRYELKNEIISGYKLLMPIVIVLATAIYFARTPIIYILFSSEFIQMADLFVFQLTGDVLKIASWLLSFLMVAKAMTKQYVFTEIVFTASFVFLSIIFINKFGVVGATYAFSANYLLYFIAMVYLFRKLVFSETSWR